MSRPTTPNIRVARIDKNGVDKTSLQQIFEVDADFTNNTEYFRPDTLEKGFKSEAERVSAEIFNKLKNKYKGDEEGLVDAMIKEVFKVNNFIGNSSFYGSYVYEIIDTEFEYIISIAYTTYW